MDLFVIHSDFHHEDVYFVVDEKNMIKKTQLIDDYPEFERLSLEEELKALKVYADGGGDYWEVVPGKRCDFYIAIIKETSW